MDFDDFEKLPGVGKVPAFKADDASAAVKHFDAAWYAAQNRKARWMDLIGDYAGSEPFVVDGESLLQLIFEDKTLALGRENDLSVQILHAKYSLERLLSEFLHRGDNFDLVFWDEYRYSILGTPLDSPFVFAALSFARVALINHAQRHLPNVRVHVFQNATDIKWQTYVRIRKPMFVLLNDGGVLETEASGCGACRVLLQRTLLFDLMSQNLSCALLRGLEFRDSKILSFVFEQRLNPEVRSRLGKQFWKVAHTTKFFLLAQETAARNRFLSTPLRDFALNKVEDGADVKAVVESVVKQFLSVEQMRTTLNSTLLYLFAAHIVLLPTLSVTVRARRGTKLHDKLHQYLRSTFLPFALLSLERIASETSVEIDIDGHVFLDILALSSTQPTASLVEFLGEAIHSTLQEIWTEYSLPVADFVNLSSQFPLEAYSKQDEPATTHISVLPFHNHLFDETSFILQGVVTESGNDPGQIANANSVRFVDNRHWHNQNQAILPKHLGGDGPVVVSKWERGRRLRSEQRFVAKMQWQAESLTGALGKPLQRITIVCDRRSQRKAVKVHHTQQPKKTKKEHISKADQIRMQNVANKKGEQDISNVAWWKEKLSLLVEKPVTLQVAEVDRLLTSRRSQEGWLSVEVQLYRLHLHFSLWIAHPDRDSSETKKAAVARDRFTVQIMRFAKDLFEQGGLFPIAIQTLETILKVLGLSCFFQSLLSTSPDRSEEDRTLHFKFVKLVRSKTKAAAHPFMAIVEHPVVWQLRLFGEYVDRSMDSQPDSRVLFKPDAWQRKVLDCLDDDGHSVLVVAPTSAGKTFISYYAMEQVLRASDDDILVYVAPTKALVSQIAAEVYARFQKTFSVSARSIWAIHTRDYRVHNPQNCQILVTVPEMLAIMLLSPPLARIWTPKIKRIILDEIHTIGQQEGGAVWEQIILLAPCPIIGLSATIGEPEKFNDWLSSVQAAHGYRHTFIHHPHRYSHLRKYDYVLHTQPSAPFSGLTDYEDTDRLRFLHPVSLLSFGPRSLPPDFSLEAADCLSLFQAFVETKDDLDFDVKTLDPVQHLPTDRLLKQKDVLAFEDLLKGKLEQIISSSDAEDDMSALSQIVRYVQDPVLAAMPVAMQVSTPSVQALLHGLIHIVADLHARNELPALFFHFDRTGCEVAAETLLNCLQKAEAKWRANSPEWKLKMQQWEMWRSQAKARQAREQKLREHSSKNDEESRQVLEPAWQESFYPGDPNPQFSFLGDKCPKSVLQDAINDIRWTATPSWVLAALRRGIGIHHSGMNKHYRTTVESLYRLGHLRVVFATGTLALGINAPTKTSVFCSDSPFLTALMYRQCAGRAGRRGFDLLGKVVFYGLPMDRVQRLVLSKIPALGGNFPLTSTMVLRLFNLLQGSDYAPYATEAVRSLLQLPQVCFSSDISKDELIHHIRFSIDYLRRTDLLDQQGTPINLFGLAAHLYYTEPSNFAMTTLLRSNVIRNICADSSLEGAKRSLLHILCHIFGRRNVPRIYTGADNIKALLAKSPSKVILAPLAASAKQALQEHDRATLKIFSGYAIAYARERGDQLGSDQYLPLSRLEYAGMPCSKDSLITQHLHSSAIQVCARSSFVANSGHGDVFTTIEDLAQNVRSGIHIKEHGIPSFRHLTTENPHALNAYILDFYIHGQVQALVVSNGIRRGEIWYLLQDFTLTLKTIRASLAQLLTARDHSDDEEDALEEVAFSQHLDPAEADGEDDGQPGVAIRRPAGVSDDDWRVYEVFHALTEDFEAKFRAMWA